MSDIYINTTLRPEGKDYKKLTFWNRFLRKKIHLICTIAPFVVSLILILTGFYLPKYFVFYVVFMVYPFIVFYQTDRVITNHMKTRDKSATAPTRITIKDDTIYTETISLGVRDEINFNKFTDVYETKTFFLFYISKRLKVNINKNDMKPEDIPELRERLVKHFDKKHCHIKKK